MTLDEIALGVRAPAPVSLDGLLTRAVEIIEEDYKNNKGDWAPLPLEPCRFCHQIGGVFFRVDDSALGKNQGQVVRCDRCGRDWIADSTSA